MNILVTGGAGFIGSHLVDRLVNDGHKVTILDNFSSGSKSNVNPKAGLYNVDISDNNIREIFSENQFEVVFHLASQIDLNLSIKDPVMDARINILGTINLLMNSVKSGVRKFIFASSGGAIYGEQAELPANESQNPKPFSPYGISKLTCEKYIDYFYRTYGMKYVILRFSNVYGPRQNLKGECGVISIFCQKILSGRQPVINGNGEQTRDFVFVDDVISANIGALKLNECDLINVSSGRETTVNEVCKEIIENYGNKFSIAHSPEISPGQLRSVIDNRLASEKLNWMPLTDINTGLIKTCKWFKDYFEN